jgi:HTH-type transcriptional regulator/antitoxin MqsA
MICQICGKGVLHPEIGKNTVEYKGKTTELDFHYSLCGACGSEQADSAQTSANKRIMATFKKRVDGLGRVLAG